MPSFSELRSIALVLVARTGLVVSDFFFRLQRRVGEGSWRMLHAHAPEEYFLEVVNSYLRPAGMEAVPKRVAQDAVLEAIAKDADFDSRYVS